ncbi:MAG TPA: carboxymuconolactone decarboxylase family protein [Steroidobacteraceae bacterium]|nr:carboxymuconolactone decarboxylase family protein [Steroidobacteraceae bacterium]
MSDPNKVFDAGLAIRREMFGAAGADEQLRNATDFDRPLQELVTAYCFGETWTRPQIDRKTRSMLTLAVLTALGRQNQVRVHVRGALANGVSRDEIREVLLHSMIYAGVPAGVDSFNTARDVFRELDKA